MEGGQVLHRSATTLQHTKRSRVLARRHGTLPEDAGHVAETMLRTPCPWSAAIPAKRTGQLTPINQSIKWLD
jgi:hypothetical protein